MQIITEEFFDDDPENTERFPNVGAYVYDAASTHYSEPTADRGLD